MNVHEHAEAAHHVQHNGDVREKMMDAQYRLQVNSCESAEAGRSGKKMHTRQVFPARTQNTSANTRG